MCNTMNKCDDFYLYPQLFVVFDGFRKSNIPALVLDERDHHDFVWYVHPYPHVELRCLQSAVANLSTRQGRVPSAGGFNRGSPKKDKKQTPFWCLLLTLVEPTGIEPVSKDQSMQLSP